VFETLGSAGNQPSAPRHDLNQLFGPGSVSSADERQQIRAGGGGGLSGPT